MTETTYSWEEAVEATGLSMADMDALSSQLDDDGVPLKTEDGRLTQAGLDVLIEQADYWRETHRDPADEPEPVEHRLVTWGQPDSLTPEQAAHLSMLTELADAWADRTEDERKDGRQLGIIRCRAMSEAFRQAHVLATAFYRAGNDPAVALRHLMPR